VRLATVFLLTAAVAVCQPFYSDKSNLLVYLDSSGSAHPVRNEHDWQRRREHILANMQRVMGPLPAKSNAPLRIEILEETKFDRYTLRKITFAAEGDDRVPAYLLIPAHTNGAGRGRGGARAPGRLPAMLCLHQTTRIGKAEPAGLGGKENLHYARELAERGIVTLAPDYPNFGDYKVDPYTMGYASATMKGIVNHRRAVDVLVSLKEVDPKRIGVIGHSLGGHNSLFAAAFDPRLRAVVTSCGFNSFAKYYSGNLTGWSHKGYMPRIAEMFDKSPARMPFDFTEILGALAPRAVFINAPLRDANFEVSGVRDCVTAARPIYEQIYRAGDRLQVEYPDAEHDFPGEVRQRAYRFVESTLR
jgi:dienelactone hydrolase